MTFDEYKKYLLRYFGLGLVVGFLYGVPMGVWIRVIFEERKVECPQ